CEVRCMKWGEEVEGWYSGCDGLIYKDDCSPLWRCIEDPEINKYCAGFPVNFKLELPADVGLEYQFSCYLTGKIRLMWMRAMALFISFK
ncbi:MAG: hypothetical protein N2746_10880, partial [Deltaproteobacteria bacterium]|nr:hypothetical protein [Deltaproteobacteria bacterium]